MILSITTFYTSVSSLRNILSLFVLLYNCLCSAGVGKSELVLRFVDSNFSGMFSAVLSVRLAVLGKAPFQFVSVFSFCPSWLKCFMMLSMPLTVSGIIPGVP